MKQKKSCYMVKTNSFTIQGKFITIHALRSLHKGTFKKKVTDLNQIKSLCMWPPMTFDWAGFLDGLMDKEYPCHTGLQFSLFCLIGVFKWYKRGLETVILICTSRKNVNRDCALGFKIEPWGHIETFSIILFQLTNFIK